MIIENKRRGELFIERNRVHSTNLMFSLTSKFLGLARPYVHPANAFHAMDWNGGVEGSPPKPNRMACLTYLATTPTRIGSTATSSEEVADVLDFGEVTGGIATARSPLVRTVKTHVTDLITAVNCQVLGLELKSTCALGFVV